MRCCLLIALVFLALAAPVHARWPVRGGAAAPGGPTGTSTLYSFDGTGTGFENQITDWTTDGSFVDSSTGQLIQVGSTFYRIGMSWEGGATWSDPGHSTNWAGPWSGFAIHSTTDLSNKSWTYVGLLFDPAPYQSACTIPTGNNGGCWTPKMIYNAANNDYVVWTQVGGGGVAGSNFLVFTCPTPTGGATPTTPGTQCTQQPNPTHVPGYGEGLFVDPNTGIGYITTGNDNRVYQLNSAFTDGTGASSASLGYGEANSMFYRAGTYYVLFGYGTLCADCIGTNTNYFTASAPLGPYSGPTQISADNCGGQNSEVTLVPDGSGGTQYIFQSDLWSAESANEAAITRYKEPLTFTGSAINPITCSASKTITGVVLSPPATKPVGSDQSSWPNGQFRASIMLYPINQPGSGSGGQSNLLQTFVPTNSGTLTAVQMALGINFSNPFVGGAYQGVPNAPLIVSIVSLDGSGNPLATLGPTVSVSGSSLTWSPQSKKLTGFSASLTAGVSYGIELSTTTTIWPGYTIGLASNNPYPAGVFKTSADLGSTWSTQANKAMLFSTFGP